MTRSYKSSKAATGHDYKIATSPNAMKIKKSGAGKHSWGSEQDMIHDIEASRMVDEIPLSLSPQESKRSFIESYKQSKQEEQSTSSLRKDSVSSSTASSEPSTSEI